MNYPKICFAIAALSALIALTSTSQAAPITLQVKSFIQAVDLTDPTEFDPDAKPCQATMSAVVTCGTIGGEQPDTGSKGGGNYRLWSEVKADVTCSGNKISKWEIHPVDYDAANEFVFITTSGEINPALKATPGLSGASTVDSVTFNYRMRGQPNVLGNATMNAVKPRTCTFIWHRIEGKLSCKNGKPQLAATLQASGFPSHRLWVDGDLVKAFPQGPFKSLWSCSPADPTLVK